MSSVCGKLDFKDADFEISTSGPTQCSKGSKNTSHSGSEDSQESDGDETDYKNQTPNEKTADQDFGKSTLSPYSSDDEDKHEENLTTVSTIYFYSYILLFLVYIPSYKLGTSFWSFKDHSS